MSTVAYNVLDEAGSEYLWETREDLREGLAGQAKLPAHLRTVARTWPRADIRSAFASRADLSPDEIEQILTTDKAAAVVAALLNRELDEAILETLAAAGRKALTEAMLKHHKEIGLTKSAKASSAIANWAIANESDLAGIKAQAARDLIGSLSFEAIDLLTDLPKTRNMSEKFSSNPGIWASAKRAEILAAAAVNSWGWQLLGSSVPQTLETPVSEEEKQHIRTWLGSDLYTTYHERLRDLAVDAEELLAWEQANDQAEIQARALKARKDQLKAQAAGADPVLARSALEKLAEMSAEDAELAVALKLAIKAHVCAPETLAALWAEKQGRIPTRILVGIAEEVDDPRCWLERLPEGSYDYLGAVEKALHKAIKNQTPGPLIDWVGQKLPSFKTRGSNHQAARILTMAGPRVWIQMDLGTLRWCGDGAGIIHAWVANELGKIAGRTGHAPSEVAGLAQVMASDELTIGQVLQGIEDTLAFTVTETIQEGPAHTIKTRTAGRGRSMQR